MKKNQYCIAVSAAMVLVAVFCLTAVVPAQHTQYFLETWDNTTGLPKTLTSGAGVNDVVSPGANGTDNEWNILFPADLGVWRIESRTAPVNSVALFHQTLGANLVRAHRGFFRSMLGSTIPYNNTWEYSLSWKLAISSSSSNPVGHIFLDLADSGGDVVNDGADAGLPTNALTLYMKTDTSASPTYLGTFGVKNSDGLTSAPVGTTADILPNVLYECTATFSRQSAGNTLVKYTVKTGGDLTHSGESVIPAEVGPGTIFDRVIIRTSNRSRCAIDDIRITAGPPPTAPWYFDGPNANFGNADGDAGQTRTSEVIVWGSGTISDIQFSGSSASEFAVVSPSLPAVLSGSITPFTLRWAPTENGGPTLTERENEAIFTDSLGTTQSLPLLGTTPKYREMRPYVPELALDFAGPEGPVVANVWPFLPAMLACNETTTFWAENVNQWYAHQGVAFYTRPQATIQAAGILYGNSVFSYGINDFFGTDAATRLFRGSSGIAISTADATVWEEPGPRGDIRKLIEDTVNGGIPQPNAWGFRSAGVLDGSGNLFFCVAQNTRSVNAGIRVVSTAETAYMDALVKASPAGPTTWTFQLLAYEDGLCYPAKIGSDIYMVKSAYQAISSIGGGEIVKVNDSTPNAGPATPVAGLGKADFAAALGLGGDSATSFALISTAAHGTDLYVGVANVGYSTSAATDSPAGNAARANDLIVKITGLPGAPVITPFITAAMLNGWLDIGGGQFGDFEPDSIAVSPSGKYLVVLSHDTVVSGPFLNNGDNGPNAREGLMIYDISGGTPVLWDAVREQQILGPIAEAGYSSQLQGTDDCLAVTEIGNDLICFFDTRQAGLRGIMKLRFDTQRASIVSIDAPAQTFATTVDFTVTLDRPIQASLAKREDFRVTRLTGDLTPVISWVSPQTGLVDELTVRVSLPGGQSGDLQLQVREDSVSLPILWKQKPYDGPVVRVYSAQTRANEWWLY